MHFAKAVIIISTNHILLSFLQVCQQISISSKLELKGIHQRECVFQECFTRRVYYIVYVYTTLHQGPMLPLYSYVLFIFHVQIKLRHTTLFFVPVVNMISAFHIHSKSTLIMQKAYLKYAFCIHEFFAHIGRRLLNSLLEVAGIREETGW